MRPGANEDIRQIVMADWRPNLSWITDMLAVGGSFPSERAEHLARDHGVRAIVDLRGETRDDEVLLGRHGMTLLHLPTNDLCASTPAQIDDGVAFARSHLAQGRRVLVHCEHGIGRSATLALCILVEGGMEPLEALGLAKDRRALVSPSPAQYECWVAWMRGHPAAPRIPSFDAFKAIAYRHLSRP